MKLNTWGRQGVSLKRVRRSKVKGRSIMKIFSRYGIINVMWGEGRGVPGSLVPRRPRICAPSRS